MAISSTTPFPLFCSGMWEGDYISIPERRKKEDKKTEAKNIMNGGRGKEKKGTRKIKNVSRAEAGRKLPMGLSAGKLTSNCP